MTLGFSFTFFHCHSAMDKGSKIILGFQILVIDSLVTKYTNVSVAINFDEEFFMGYLLYVKLQRVVLLCDVLFREM